MPVRNDCISRPTFPPYQCVAKWQSQTDLKLATTRGRSSSICVRLTPLLKMSGRMQLNKTMCSPTTFRKISSHCWRIETWSHPLRGSTVRCYSKKKAPTLNIRFPTQTTSAKQPRLMLCNFLTFLASAFYVWWRASFGVTQVTVNHCKLRKHHKFSSVPHHVLRSPSSWLGVIESSLDLLWVSKFAVISWY